MDIEEKEILFSLERKVLDFEYSLEFQKQTNDAYNESIKLLKESVDTLRDIDKEVLQKFEVINLKLKNKDLENKLLHSKIETLKKTIEIMKIRNNN